MADPTQGEPSLGWEAGAASLTLRDAAATRALGRQLARRLLDDCRPGQTPLLLLRGDLGAGKTCLVQGLAEELGIDEPITSPTFALAQHYRGRRQSRDTHLVHLDLYRLEPGFSADELFAQEEEEAQALGALLALEWPERLSQPPQEAWEVRLTLLHGQAPGSGRLAEVQLCRPAEGAGRRTDGLRGLEERLSLKGAD